LANGASLPVNAAAAAKDLGAFRWVRSTKHRAVRDEAGNRIQVVMEEVTDPKPNGSDLQSAVERLILLYARKTQQYREEALAVFVEHSIKLSLDSGSAAISYHPDDDQWMVDYYAASDTACGDTTSKSTLLHRNVEVKLPLSLMIVCGGLLAESWAGSTANMPFSPSGDASASADPEPPNDDTPSLPGPGVSIRNHDRPRANATTEAVHTSEVRGLGEFPQARSGSRPVNSPKGDPDHARAYP
jgi:hypothetical protein